MWSLGGHLPYKVNKHFSLYQAKAWAAAHVYSTSATAVTKCNEQKIQQGQSAVGMQKREQAFLPVGYGGAAQRSLCLGEWIGWQQDEIGSHSPQAETQNEQSHEKFQVLRKRLSGVIDSTYAEHSKIKE